MSFVSGTISAGRASGPIVSATARARGGDQVVDVDDALEPVEAPAADRVARVRRLDVAVDRVGGRQVGVEPGDVERGDHDVARLAVGEVEHVVQQLLLRARDHAGLLRLVDQRPQLRGVADRLAGGDLADPERAQDQRRRALQDPHHRPQHDRDQLDRARDQHRERLGLLERQRLRHELAEHDGQVGDDREGEHVGRPARQRVADQPADERLGQRAGEDADRGDADLHGRDHAHRIVHQAQRGRAPAPALQRGTARRDHGVLPDHEEGVAGDEAEHREDPEEVAHRVR